MKNFKDNYSSLNHSSCTSGTIGQYFSLHQMLQRKPITHNIGSDVT